MLQITLNKLSENKKRGTKQCSFFLVKFFAIKTAGKDDGSENAFKRARNKTEKSARERKKVYLFGRQKKNLREFS